jgi:hypothetical protein
MNHDCDDLDTLFMAAQPRTPERLTAGVRLRLRIERRVVVLVASLVGLLLSSLVLLLTAMALGSHVRDRGAVDLLAFAARDIALVQSDPWWFLTTLSATVFWPGVAGVTLSLLVMMWLVHVVVHAADEGQRPEDRA